MIVITAEMLAAKGACKSQVARFREHWPNGAKPLLRTIRKAKRLGLHLGWFAGEFLSPQGTAVYNDAIAKARGVLTATVFPVKDAYARAVSLAGVGEAEAVEEAEAEAWAVYREAMDQALAVYHEAEVQALYTAIKEHGLETDDE